MAKVEDRVFLSGNALVDLKQIDCQLFSQKKKKFFFFFLISKELQFGVFTMVSHAQVPGKNGKENSFIKGKGGWEGYRKQRVHGFSLAGL